MAEISKKIDRITFGLLSPEDVKKLSYVKIVTPELYDKEGYPVDGGLMDTRMGVIDPGLTCRTCGEKLKECAGHFGYIDLARPIIHVKYVRVILDLLKSTCRECGRILLDDKEIAKHKTYLDGLDKRDVISRRRRTKLIKESLKNIRKCPHCKEKQYSVKIEKPTSFMENDKRLTPIDVKTRLDKIQNLDAELLGFNTEHAKPSSTIITLLFIPPVTMRPSITLESGERSEDDLTHKLGDIVRINQRLFENINAGAPEVIVEDLWDLLQYHITTYFDNTLTDVPPARHRSGQPLKTLTERIKSKEGRFRYNLAGKRVNFAARTVVSPDPEIEFNEVGIPKQVAMDLTVPERVTQWNIERLKKFVEKGPKTYPGSNYVLRPDGRKKKITDETKEQLLEELQPGYIVERHLMDGDIAIFNRQPSLHKMSIMGHRVRVIPGRSFRLNPAVCYPYNADFDGDEMNLHIPQTEEARAEAEVLMEVQTQLISPKHGLNVIGCMEDSVSGNYLLTREMNLSKEEAINLLMNIGVNDTSKFKKFKSQVTGREIFSILLPKDLNFITKNRDDEEVIIKDGELIQGTIDSDIIGEEGGTLIRKLHKDYGEDETLRILSIIFKLGIKALEINGFTTGINDTDLEEELVNRIKQVVNDTNKEVKNLIAKYHNNELDAMPSKTIEETLELMILQLLNKVRNKVGELIAENASPKNPTIIMANSGAKGNILNLAMMSALVGQQALRGRRIEKGYEGRTLSLFKKGELSPKSKGFIESAFKEGLDPTEFFFGAMTGRDSLMDTALRTPKSGYLYRRLANALQDLKIEYDYTVRDANKMIIQFKYGEDGIDVAKSEKGTINIKGLIREVTGK
ncbi:DNA-directed RNA polymerase subunit A' [Candidatus Woesearchaeota archaeon]|nr:DNA-directed RNA polymerase subunit A' [Candidatus Woesearchaeota archaeon]